MENVKDIRNVSYTITQDEDGRWNATKYFEDTKTYFYGYGNTPSEALNNIQEEIEKKEYVKPTIEKIEDDNEKIPFKPLDVIKNHVNEFIDNLSPDDKCLINISTDVWRKATSDKIDSIAGDIYFALVARKEEIIPEGYTLYEGIDYPAKKVYEFFQNVK